MNFFYSFTETILHSLWQAMLLVMFYYLVNFIIKNIHPLQKRNFLYLLLVAQIAISILTFLSYFNGYSLATKLAFTKSLEIEYFTFLKQYNNSIFTVYIIIVLFKVSSLSIQWVGFKRNYKKELIRPSATIKVFTEIKAHHLGIKRKVEIWYSKNIKTPITFGFLKPVILLPFTLLNNISATDAEAIILHELVHIKSKDYLFNWLIIGIEIIYFFNPFLKILVIELKQEREKNCDVQVINFEYGVLQYAQTLLGIAQNNMEVKDFQLGTVKKASQLFQRIKFFSNEKNLMFSNIQSYTLTILSFPLLMVICLILVTKSINKNKVQSDVVSINTNEIPHKKNILNDVINISRKENNNIVIRTSKINKTENIVVKNLPSAVEQPSQNELYIPVVLNETADSTKDVIYNLETQNGKLTQSYKMIKKNGVWIFEPQWMIVETKGDSMLFKIKDSMKKTLLIQ